MDNSVTSILLVGVGGQGIIRASDILSVALMNAGYDVKKSEVHGMAQRGGCVSSHVRFGKKVYSPLSKKGDVDILISFEKMETLRYLDYPKKDGTVIINNEEIYPPAVNLGEAPYPADVDEYVKQHFSDVKIIDASEIALQNGDHRMANTIMLAVLSSYLDLTMDTWDAVFRSTFKEKAALKNLDVFHRVRKDVEERRA